MNEYKTILKEATAEIVMDRSRFIAVLRPVQTEEEVTALLTQQKQKYHDARHHVYAYRLRQGNIARYTDDGEPHSTAGLPSLEVLKGADLVDVAVVTTRYFGGILLGTGGLVRAYSGAVKAAIENAQIAVVSQAQKCSLQCDYSKWGGVEILLQAGGAQFLNVEYMDVVTVTFHIKDEDVAPLQEKLTDLLLGVPKWQNICQEYAIFEEK